MAELLNLSDLVVGTTTSTICVRVLRKWKHYGKDAGFEMVFLDDENTSIHASTDYMMMNRLDKRFEEGFTYKVSKFSVSENVKIGYQDMATDHPLRIFLKYETLINECQAPNISDNKFNFESFEDVLQEIAPKEQYIDVIGKLVTVDPIQKSANGKVWTILVLQDIAGHELNCSIWSDYTVEVSAIHNKYLGATARPIVVLQYVLWSQFKGDNRVSTVRGATRIFVNPGIPEAAEYKDKCLLEPSQSSSSRRSSAAPVQDLFAGATITKLADLLQVSKAGQYLIKATVVSVAENEDWYFNSCNKCRSKCIYSTSDKLWFCKKTDCPASRDGMKTITPRFQVRYFVTGGADDFAELMFFDHHVRRMITKTATDVIKEHEQGVFKDVTYKQSRDLELEYTQIRRQYVEAYFDSLQCDIMEVHNIGVAVISRVDRETYRHIYNV